MGEVETAGIRKEVHEEIDRMTDEEVRSLKESRWQSDFVTPIHSI